MMIGSDDSGEMEMKVTKARALVAALTAGALGLTVFAIKRLMGNTSVAQTMSADEQALFTAAHAAGWPIDDHTPRCTDFNGACLTVATHGGVAELRLSDDGTTFVVESYHGHN